jgi:hypothetical protein
MLRYNHWPAPFAEAIPRNLQTWSGGNHEDYGKTMNVTVAEACCNLGVHLYDIIEKRDNLFRRIFLPFLTPKINYY